MATYILVKTTASHHNWRVAIHGKTLATRVPILQSREKFDIANWGDGHEHNLDYIIVNNVTQEEAEQLATSLATKTLGVTWYVTQLVSGVVTPAADPVKLTITDKGVLPA